MVSIFVFRLPSAGKIFHRQKLQVNNMVCKSMTLTLYTAYICKWHVTPAHLLILRILQFQLPLCLPFSNTATERCLVCNIVYVVLHPLWTAITLGMNTCCHSHPTHPGRHHVHVVVHKPPQHTAPPPYCYS